ncbi:hypothetical protein OK024_05330 [Acinetobacter sp. UGAL515B_02]|uniref:A1S_1983 family putative colistin resistance protein n=1 Tax=Acinetobacter soli TaxID=487316 RepID=UPI001ABC6CC4|nr:MULTISPECIES: hypothetical protein [Acinetobacter]MBO3672167.1 hypothetical protein [Acinetobacter soli]MBV6550235.1 hypothetical protein [Acinetobacter soli]WON81116.1 hypothetical protein OK024_05330 [Acinetobacter sp. UGAL515B_02]
MPFNTDRFPLKNVAYVLMIGGWCTFTQAFPLSNCDAKSDTPLEGKICSGTFKSSRQALDSKFLTAYLVSDAPVQLLKDTHTLWLNQTKLCKTSQCIKQQFDVRSDELNTYTSLNQTLTQHFLKYDNGTLATSPVHLQVHQLSKDKIKIEGIAYRNPNNRSETQTVPFLAYTSPEKKNQIVDNEHDCAYTFNFQKSLLVVKTEQKGCERFTGIYRLYD